MLKYYTHFRSKFTNILKKNVNHPIAQFLF